VVILVVVTAGYLLLGIAGAVVAVPLTAVAHRVAGYLRNPDDARTGAAAAAWAGATPMACAGAGRGGGASRSAWWRVRGQACGQPATPGLTTSSALPRGGGRT
jgi:hypothetical protein